MHSSSIREHHSRDTLSRFLSFYEIRPLSLTRVTAVRLDSKSQTARHSSTLLVGHAGSLNVVLRHSTAVSCTLDRGGGVRFGSRTARHSSTSLAGHFVTPVAGPAGKGQVAACVLLIYDARFLYRTIFCIFCVDAC